MFTIKIAELKIRINNIFSFSNEFCKEYLIEDDDKYDFSITPTMELINKELKCNIKYLICFILFIIISLNIHIFTTFWLIRFT